MYKMSKQFVLMALLPSYIQIKNILKNLVKLYNKKKSQNTPKKKLLNSMSNKNFNNNLLKYSVCVQNNKNDVNLKN